MSDPFLILEGERAACWLGMLDYDVGLASPACYPQGKDDIIVKVKRDVCLVKGSAITEKIEKRWAEAAPDGVLLHRPGLRDAPRLNDIIRRCH
ncbi:hypothetical protein [uncultured Sneathiella sp.]|uniref:hypothetical protein n=1 Tax=uncultured Sneathiella sp. TaxID=879315 RepID=UPI0030EC217F